MHIDIVNSNSEIKLWKFQWRYSRIPEVLSKSFWSLIDAELSPLFTDANCTLILLLVAEKSNFEIFNVRHSRIPEVLSKKVFEAWLMQNLVLYSLAQTAH